MNYRGCRQRFLSLPDLSRKIEGDSVRRVPYQKSEKIIQTLLLFHDMVTRGCGSVYLGVVVLRV